MHQTTRLVVKSKNEFIMIILVLIFIVVNFGFLVVALDVGLNPIHEGKHVTHEGDHVGTQDPLLAREFPRHRITRPWSNDGAQPKMRQQVLEVEELWLQQECQTGLWWSAHN
jgi:hypothetical protein